MNARNEILKGIYFGNEVDILMQLNNCALVQYQGREFIVETADLMLKQSRAKAA